MDLTVWDSSHVIFMYLRVSCNLFKIVNDFQISKKATPSDFLKNISFGLFLKSILCEEELLYYNLNVKTRTILFEKPLQDYKGFSNNIIFQILSL